MCGSENQATSVLYAVRVFPVFVFVFVVVREVTPRHPLRGRVRREGPLNFGHLESVCQRCACTCVYCVCVCVCVRGGVCVCSMHEITSGRVCLRGYVHRCVRVVPACVRATQDLLPPPHCHAESETRAPVNTHTHTHTRTRTRTHARTHTHTRTPNEAGVDLPLALAAAESRDTDWLEGMVGERRALALVDRLRLGYFSNSSSGERRRRRTRLCECTASTCVCRGVCARKWASIKSADECVNVCVSVCVCVCVRLYVPGTCVRVLR